MSAKHLYLHVAGRVVVMKIQPNFSPGNYPGVRANQILCLLFGEIIIVPGIMRVSSDGCIDVVVLLSKIDCSFESFTVRIPGPYIEYKIHFRIASSIDNLFPITIELSAIEMCV